MPDRRVWALASTIVLAAGAPTLAQTAPARSDTSSGDRANPAAADGQDIVVTGRAGSGQRTKLDTSYSITTIDNAALQSRAPSSVTEALKSVPGFWVEASGGEGSGNVRARGIPIDGYGSVNLLEDGMPVQHDPALGYLNADQAFRIDQSIDRIEVVRGGPSSVFYSNAPGGVVNFITKRPGDQLSAVGRLLYGPTADLYRADGWIGTPIGDGWRIDAGGFYRHERGVRDPGFTGNHGGQIRADLSKIFDHGKLTLSYKHLDDHAIFYTGIPLTRNASGDVVGLPGFDPHYGSTASPATEHLTLLSGNGPVQFNSRDGSAIRLDEATALAEWDFGGGFRLTNNARYRDSHTVRNGVYPSSVSTAAAYIASVRPTLLAAYPGATGVVIRYADGQPFDVAGQNGNGDIFLNAARPVTVNESEFLDDLRLAKKVDLLGHHDIAIGGYVARIHETFRRYSAATLQDVSDKSRLLDLFAVDATGQIVGSLTDHGVVRYGSEFANGYGHQTTLAAYASDEWQIAHSLRLDAGLRYEHVATDGAQEGMTSVNLGNPATLADNSVLTGNGVFLPYDRSFHRVGATVGVDWQFAHHAGAFARYTSAFRLPSVGSFITSATAVPRTQGIHLYEAGLKYSDRLFSTYATGFLTDFNAYSIGNYQFDPVTGSVTQQTIYTDTRAYGVEFEGTVRPVTWFDFSLIATYTGSEFRNLRYNELQGNNTLIARDYSGNQLLRIPKLALRATPAVTLFDGRLRTQVDVEHYTKRYADAANTQILPAYTLVNASIRFALTDHITLWAYGDNLNNSLGLTEGNPRSGELTSNQANDQLFIGRPELGRAFRFAADVSF